MALIFIDLDGTLLHNGKPAEGAKETVDLLKKNNHTIVIATGRNPNLLYGIDKELGIENMVLANGGYIVYKNKVVMEKYIDKETVKRMMSLADQEKFDLVIEYHDGYVSYRKDTSVSDQFSEIFMIEKAKLDRTIYPNRNVFAMLIFDDLTIVKIKDQFPELQFNKSNQFGYDINPKGDLKAEGVKTLVDYLKYPEDEVYAIGDGFNDILMLKAVKHSIAMGNAFPEVKEVAEFVTTDVLDLGVYKAMKHYKLI
jgi:Cof subfamily protein (haloacid dehalogenase superfamily)